MVGFKHLGSQGDFRLAYKHIFLRFLVTKVLVFEKLRSLRNTSQLYAYFVCACQWLKCVPGLQQVTLNKLSLFPTFPHNNPRHKIWWTGLMTLTFFSFIFYIFVCQRAAIFLEQSQSNAPTHMHEHRKILRKSESGNGLCNKLLYAILDFMKPWKTLRLSGKSLVECFQYYLLKIR